MRLPGIGDVIAAARVLRARPAGERHAAMARIIAMAEHSDRWRLARDRPHPLWGTGSLMSAALRLPAAPEPRMDDSEWRNCLLLAMAAVDLALSAPRPPPLASVVRQPIFRTARLQEPPMPQTPEAARPPPEADPAWNTMRAEAARALQQEPALAPMLRAFVLDRNGFEEALAHLVARKLATEEVGAPRLLAIATALHADNAAPGRAARADLQAVLARDPACHRLIEPLLYFKGFAALQCHRLAHLLWRDGRRDLALWLQGRISEVFAVDIHPAARIGQGIMMDHAHGVVIGETAVIGNSVSLLHGVTLGGTGKDEGERHPRIADGVLIGAGATVLGNITVGRCSRIAAGSVVLEDVPPMTTVAGVPARVIGEAGCPDPAEAMNQILPTG